jgi:large subunit ribosomal protein L5
MSALKTIYEGEVRQKLQLKYSYSNPHQIPKVEKIQISAGLGLNAQNNNYLQRAIEEIRLISGQHPVITKAKKSVAGFKIRQGMSLGIFVTLRRAKMYAFLEKLNKLVFPRIRDFRGLSALQFDNSGNYHFGISDQLVFPEIDFNSVEQKRGFNISIITTASTVEESYTLLKELGFPFN